MEGFILLHRKLLENAIFYKPDYFQVWIYILLRVGHKEKDIIWNGQKKKLNKGSGIFSQRKISQELGIATGTVNNILKYLKTERQIETKTSNKFTEIQVVKWEEYQAAERKPERKVNAKRTQRETNNNDNNENNLEGECQQFISKYSQAMIEKFLRYWTEKNSKGKQKWQLEETWELEKRLATWKSREFNYGAGKVQVRNGANGAIV